MKNNLLIFLLLIAFITSCTKEEVKLSDGKIIGEGDIVTNEYVVLKPNYDHSAYCDRIAIEPATSTYQMYEVGRTIEEGVYQLRLINDNAVATVEKVGVRSSAIYFHDLLISLKNGDVLHTEGFEVLPYQSPSFNPQKIETGLYYVSKKDGYVSPGRYQIQQSSGGAVYIQQFPLEYLDMQSFYQSQNDYIDLKEGNYVIITKDAFLKPELSNTNVKNSITFDVENEDNDTNYDDMNVFFEELQTPEPENNASDENPTLDEDASDVITQ